VTQSLQPSHLRVSVGRGGPQQTPTTDVPSPAYDKSPLRQTHDTTKRHYDKNHVVVAAQDYRM